MKPHPKDEGQCFVGFDCLFGSYPTMVKVIVKFSTRTITPYSKEMIRRVPNQTLWKREDTEGIPDLVSYYRGPTKRWILGPVVSVFLRV